MYTSFQDVLNMCGHHVRNLKHDFLLALVSRFIPFVSSFVRLVTLDPSLVLLIAVPLGRNYPSFHVVVSHTSNTDWKTVTKNVEPCISFASLV